MVDGVRGQDCYLAKTWSKAWAKWISDEWLEKKRKRKWNLIFNEHHDEDELISKSLRLNIAARLDADANAIKGVSWNTSLSQGVKQGCKLNSWKSSKANKPLLKYVSHRKEIKAQKEMEDEAYAMQSEMRSDRLQKNDKH